VEIEKDENDHNEVDLNQEKEARKTGFYYFWLYWHDFLGVFIEKNHSVWGRWGKLSLFYLKISIVQALVVLCIYHDFLEANIGEALVLNLVFYILILAPLRIFEFFYESGGLLVRMLTVLVLTAALVLALFCSFYYLFELSYDELIIWTASYLIGTAINFLVYNTASAIFKKYIL
jgi:di/tricarboxylate transporter